MIYKTRAELLKLGVPMNSLEYTAKYAKRPAVRVRVRKVNGVNYYHIDDAMRYRAHTEAMRKQPDELSLNEATAMLRIGRAKAGRLVREGVIPARQVQVDGDRCHYYIKRSDVYRYLGVRPVDYVSRAVMTRRWDRSLGEALRSCV